MQYVHPSSLAGGIGQLSADGGFAGPGGDNDDISGDREGGLRLWEAKYQFQKDMLPMFVGEAFGRKVGLYGGVRCNKLIENGTDLLDWQKLEFYPI